MSVAAYDIAIAYDAPLVMGRDGTPLAAYRTTRNGTPFGPLHATRDGAKHAANLALYQEAMGYPPVRLATEGVAS